MEQKLTPRRILRTTHYTSHITKYILHVAYVNIYHIYRHITLIHIVVIHCKAWNLYQWGLIVLCVCVKGNDPGTFIMRDTTQHRPLKKSITLFEAFWGYEIHEAWSFHSTGPLSPAQTIQAFWMLCCPESLQKVTEDSPRCLLHKPVAATGPRIVCQKAEDRSRKKCNVKTERTSETMLHVVHLHTRTSSGVPDFHTLFLQTIKGVTWGIPPKLNIIIFLFTSPKSGPNIKFCFFHISILTLPTCESMACWSCCSCKADPSNTGSTAKRRSRSFVGFFFPSRQGGWFLVFFFVCPQPAGRCSIQALPWKVKRNVVENRGFLDLQIGKRI